MERKDIPDELFMYHKRKLRIRFYVGIIAALIVVSLFVYFCEFVASPGIYAFAAGQFVFLWGMGSAFQEAKILEKKIKGSSSDDDHWRYGI